MDHNNTYFTQETFKERDFSKENFEGYRFSQCIFEDCNFTESTFQGALFFGCIFRDCTISLVDLKDARFENVTFEFCKLVGLNFSRCDTKLLFSFHAKSSFVQHCTFFYLSLKNISFQESKIIQCNFYETNLQNACFKKADLSGTIFSKCNLQQADFKEAQNYLINPCENKIKKAQFSFPECIGLLKALDVTIEGI